MREPAARRALYRGDKHLATAWQNDDGSWSWRLAGNRGFHTCAIDMDAAQRAARKAVSGKDRLQERLAPMSGWRTRGLEGSAAGVVATGVRGDPTVQRCVREAIGGVLCSARHSDGDAVVVSMEALEVLAHSILVDFE